MVPSAPPRAGSWLGCALSTLREPQTPFIVLLASATGSAGMVPEGAGDRVRHSPKGKDTLGEDKRKSTRTLTPGMGVPCSHRGNSLKPKPGTGSRGMTSRIATVECETYQTGCVCFFLWQFPGALVTRHLQKNTNVFAQRVLNFTNV